jgi:Domain of unknown function (DUF4333)
MAGVRRSVSSIVSLVTLLLALSGCGESTTRPGATEQTVSKFVFKHTGFRPSDVRCPSGVPAKVGSKLECHFTGPDGPYTAYVRILKVHGERAVDHIVTRPSRNPRAG